MRHEISIKYDLWLLIEFKVIKFRTFISFLSSILLDFFSIKSTARSTYNLVVFEKEILRDNQRMSKFANFERSIYGDFDFISLPSHG